MTWASECGRTTGPKRPRTLASALLASCAVLVLQSAFRVALGAVEPPPVPCNCSDVDPRRGYNDRVEFSCMEQRQLGQCTKPFMFDSVKEVPEGYCMISCGRCDCCESAWEVIGNITGADVSEYVEAARAVGFSRDLDEPGFMGTVLVPTSQAFEQFFRQSEGTPWRDLASTSEGRKRLKDILRHNALAPTDVIKAVWTTPFMTGGHGSAKTLVGGDVWFSRPEGGRRIVASNERASVDLLEGYRDLPACKAYVNVVSWVLPMPTPRVEAADAGP
ncbi:unnamed protein product [Pedinophyceae sp. YPF-701]|nr:unnamed protein product [Pedinophyceae sp. YPF-701]